MLSSGFLFLFIDTWLWYHFLILGAIILLFLVFGIIFITRCIKWRRCREESQYFGLNELNQMIKPFGFAYDIKSDLFYSLIDSWQRDQGYGRLYDEGAIYFSMLIDCEPIYFSYKGKQWLIQFWKGQYGMTTGAEVGLYNRRSDKGRKIGFYHAATDDEMMTMAYVLRKHGKIIMMRDALHWWLTGFNLGEYSRPRELSLEVWIDFPNLEMQRAFLGGLERAGYKGGEVCCSENNYRVYICFDHPHTKNPRSHHRLYAAWVRRFNRRNCQIYQKLTKCKGCNTLEKLQYLMRFKPRTFLMVMKNLKNLYPKPPRKVLRLCRRDEKKYGSIRSTEERARNYMPKPPCCDSAKVCVNVDPCTCKGEDNKNPYACRGEENKNPYASRGEENKDPCGCRREDNKNPYASRGEENKDPCGCRGEDNKNPYASRGEENKDPYGCGEENRNPYAYSREDNRNPFACNDQENGKGSCR